MEKKGRGPFNGPPIDSCALRIPQAEVQYVVVDRHLDTPNLGSLTFLYASAPDTTRRR